MNRGIVVLIGVIVLAVATAAGIYHMRQPKAPADWMRHEYGLTQEQADRVAKIERDYGSRCAEMCARINRANEHLSELVRTNRAMTAEVRAAITAADEVRTDCRTSMLAHFYEVAAVMPEEKRAEYLKTVLPAVLHPEEMGGQRITP